jgi:hypothetical protein
MPKTVTIELDPSWKAKTEEEKAAAARAKPIQVSYVSAQEAVSTQLGGHVPHQARRRGTSAGGAIAAGTPLTRN